MIMSKQFLPLLARAARRTTTISSSSSGLHCNRAANINISIIGSVSFCYKAENCPTWYGYIYSKAALTMATSIMGRELRSDDVLVAAVHPGNFRTCMGGADAPVPVEEAIGKLLFAALNDSTVRLLHSNSGQIIPW